MMAEFKKIQAEMYETFCKKQRNYGPGNIILKVLVVKVAEEEVELMVGQ